MSTAKGNSNRKRPQKYQNKTAFKNDLHDTSNKTKLINNLEISGVCKRCKDILDWKIKYKKYKPLTAPRKCVGCDQKTVKHAYHMLCSKCATEKKVCAKCCKPFEIENPTEHSGNNNQVPDIKLLLKDLPERKRRTILRFINKHQDGSQTISPDILSEVQNMVDNITLDDESFLDSASNSESEDNEE